MHKQTMLIHNRKARRAALKSRMPRKDETQGTGATAGTGTGEQNNSGGNSGENSNADGNQNNPSPEDALASFWNPEPEGEKSPESGSAGNAPSGSTQPTLAQTLGTQLEGMSFEPVLNKEMLEAFGNGDVEGFNAALKPFGQQVAKHTLNMVVGILKEFREEVLGEATGHTDKTIQGREEFADLVKAIPGAAAEGPGSKTIRDIYQQALKNNKGNRTVAIQQTKDVMKLQAQMFGGELGLEVAPRDSGSGSYTPPAKTNWLESLAGR